MKETQLLKGVLEGCVLDMIGQKERYGYELVQTLREAGFDTIVPGTIYPLLQKLEKNTMDKRRHAPVARWSRSEVFFINERRRRACLSLLATMGRFESKSRRD